MHTCLDKHLMYSMNLSNVVAVYTFLFLGRGYFSHEEETKKHASTNQLSAKYWVEHYSSQVSKIKWQNNGPHETQIFFRSKENSCPFKEL